MKKRMNWISRVVVLLIVFAMVLSVAFFAAEVCHDCTGGDCAICHVLNSCENAMKGLLHFCMAAGLADAILSMPCRIGTAVPEAGNSFTPVSLKVKLSN